jgi:hypothetical protein
MMEMGETAEVEQPSPFERVSAAAPQTPRAPQAVPAPETQATGPAFGRKGKPNKRGARRDPNAAPPPSVEAPVVAEVPVATPTRHGPIGGSDAWLESDLPRPEVHILESVGATPPGAPTDRYRVAESGPSGPTRRPENQEEQGRESA